MAIPPLFMIFPARIKNGIANKLNTEIPEKIRCAPVNTATSISITGRIAHTDDTPSATAIGTPATNIMTSRTKMMIPDTIAILINQTPPIFLQPPAGLNSPCTVQSYLKLHKLQLQFH